MKLIAKISLLSLAFLPLVVDNLVFFPFINGKNLIFRILIFAVCAFIFSYFLYSKTFRSEIYSRFKNILNSPLFLSVSAFFLVFLASTFFAVDKYRAFFGNAERAEGFIAMTFLIGFFLFTLLIFKKKDWLWFFKLTLFSGLILFIKELIEVFQGVARPGSFTGNPIYLAAFFLFVILAGLIVFSDAKRKQNIFWIWCSVVAVIVSLAGILITETRGVFIGIVLGFIFVLIFLLFQGKSLYLFRSLDLRRLSAIILILIIFSGTAFLLTKQQPLWQKLPILNRLAQISLEDRTTRSRLISWGIALESVSPKENGFQKFLIGWGPENFSIAFNKNYNPEIYAYERQFFDRAHNKLLDVLVMNGLLGLLAYLAIWISFFYLILRKSFLYQIQNTGYRILERSALLFFGVAYFIQNLFVFDTIITYISFFFVMAYVIYRQTDAKLKRITNTKNSH